MLTQASIQVAEGNNTPPKVPEGDDEARSQADVPVATVEELGQADAVLFGTPTRFGNMTGQMRQFLDATGGIWKTTDAGATWRPIFDGEPVSSIGAPAGVE